MDEIVIESMRLKSRIGVNHWEQNIEQTIIVDLHLIFDFIDIADDISATLDYDAICHHIQTFTSKHAFNLIETAANEIAREILKEYPVKQVKVIVNKPHALRQAANVKAIVTRYHNKG